MLGELDVGLDLESHFLFTPSFLTVGAMESAASGSLPSLTSRTVSLETVDKNQPFLP